VRIIIKGDKQMNRNTKTVLISAILGGAALMLAAGCGQARSSAPVTEKPSAQVVTEAPVIMVTEAPVIETEVETQTETQPQTELQTQPATTPVTETAAQTEAALSKEEELAQENEYADWVTMYANDDINVRESPDAASTDNVISSYDKLEEVTVRGETPGWYEVYKDYDTVSGLSEMTGFVKKEFLSATLEEAQKAAPQETAAPAAGDTTQTAASQTVSADTTTAAADTAQTTAPADNTQTAPASGDVITMASDANIRADASETSDVIGVVSAGTKVSRIGSSGNWYQIDYNGTQGYVNANLAG